MSSVFLAIVAVTVTGAVASWTGYGDAKFAVFVFVFGAYFVVLCLHEFGHAYAAHLAGDSGVAARGYLDLNPLRYLNPVLSLLLPAIYLALGGLPLPGGAVLVDRTVARKRWQAAMISASGPLFNIQFAVIAMVAIALAAPTVGAPFIVGGSAIFGPHQVFWQGVSFFAYIQVAVALLNLIPVPGLDGFGIIEPYLRPETRRGLEPIRPYGILLVLLLLVAFPPVRDGFSHAVESIMSTFGQPYYGPGQGRDAFMFWQH
ncbi:site-2 protease family protein [Actinocrinis puniceicyclus]|uniref:Site-2 protease family protein n=1 Tax=Actinocrinis puniceicyclus TaxID=977794 RepID=A0A8J8BEY1_9ACTN|nr:site-2 protease family protein [Actinocrinis puniceicyclus]MBS2964209.1 site-2 protease family protein [Actinocrinis puniceicyclus]